MKKLFIYMSFIAAALMGCNEDLETEGLSRIIYYPTFNLEGGNLIVHPIGEPYSEPGVKVTEEGADIEFTSEGTVDSATPGFYHIVYSAVNKEGYAGSETRTVVVMEPNLPELDIEGGWTSNTGGPSSASFNQKLTITKIADGIYEATDSYSHSAVEIPVRFLINADGTATLEPIPHSPFGLPMYGKITFNVPAGGTVQFPGGVTRTAPVAADMAFGIFLDDPDAPFYTVKTWLKD